MTLENIDIRLMVQSGTIGFLNSHRHGLIIDEAQNFPELFSYLHVVVDEYKEYRYILTGISNFSLMEKVLMMFIPTAMSPMLSVICVS